MSKQCQLERTFDPDIVLKTPATLLQLERGLDVEGYQLQTPKTILSFPEREPTSWTARDWSHYLNFTDPEPELVNGWCPWRNQ